MLYKTLQNTWYYKHYYYYCYKLILKYNIIIFQAIHEFEFFFRVLTVVIRREKGRGEKKDFRNQQLAPTLTRLEGAYIARAHCVGVTFFFLIWKK